MNIDNTHCSIYKFVDSFLLHHIVNQIMGTYVSVFAVAFFSAVKALIYMMQ